MDAFEQVVAGLLEQQGYWTLTSYKVRLTKDDKLKIGRPNSPRWEIDVVAYKGKTNELRIVECKSFLNSIGVECGAFNGTKKSAESRYKLFREENTRTVVLHRLVEQLEADGFCATNPTTHLCLAAGNIHGDEEELQQHFDENSWTLYRPGYIQAELRRLKGSGYENNIAAVVTKLLLRGERSASSEQSVDADA